MRGDAERGCGAGMRSAHRQAAARGRGAGSRGDHQHAVPVQQVVNVVPDRHLRANRGANLRVKVRWSLGKPTWIYELKSGERPGG